MESKPNKVKKFNQPYIGLIIGIILPLIVFFSYYTYLYFQDSSLQLVDFISSLIIKNAFTAIITVCVTPNLILFFIFRKLDYWYAIRGLIISVVIYTFIAIIAKII